MAHVIAMAGKGGVGKTTLCGLLIQYLCETGRKPVLAVDADANSNLNEVLGVEVESTLGEIREEIERAGTNALPVGMQKTTWAEMRLNDALTEDVERPQLALILPLEIFPLALPLDTLPLVIDGLSVPAEINKAKQFLQLDVHASLSWTC